ncbi:MAG: STAS domain-containing protein [Firmicutes bacterium]|nr:STAS domain-containing protein [Bacillota bacterium]
MLKMDMEYNHGILFVRLDGILNRSTSYKLNNYLVPVILKHKIKYLVYNCFLLESIDECGMNAILNTKCAIKTNKGKMYVCEIANEYEKQFKKAGLKETSSELTALNLLKI